MALGHAVHREVIPRDSRGDAVSLMEEFRVEVARKRYGVHVRPVGEVDLATVGSLREHLEASLASAADMVVLDLRDTTFLDSTGLRLTVELADRAARGGIEFAIIAGPRQVQRTFELAGLSALLPFVDVPRG